MDTRQWRAVAIGWAAALVAVVFVGFSMWLPAIAIGTTVVVYAGWRS
jgi:hypothetical protein